MSSRIILFKVLLHLNIQRLLLLWVYTQLLSILQRQSLDYLLFLFELLLAELFLSILHFLSAFILNLFLTFQDLFRFDSKSKETLLIVRHNPLKLLLVLKLLQSPLFRRHWLSEVGWTERRYFVVFLAIKMEDPHVCRLLILVWIRYLLVDKG